MLEYYSLYYKTVANESIYFLRSRVILPFRYYQHGVGLEKFDVADAFSNTFYNRSEAERAYYILSAAFELATEDGFPSGENFVAEYSLFFSKLAKSIEK